MNEFAPILGACWPTFIEGWGGLTCEGFGG
jgi:hypothetical protein